jgi:cysteine desulfurase
MTAQTRTYLDYNATAPLRPEARAAMLDALAVAGNPSSVHAEGRAARAIIERGRERVAGLVGVEAKLVTFVSGGTEANNAVLTPEWRFRGQPYNADFLLVSAVEHPSVLAGGRFAAERVRLIPVDGEGVIRLDILEKLLVDCATAGARALVSVMLANNETGAIQPIADVARLAHAAGAIVHTDAVQAAGRIPVDVQALGVDVLTLSAHKLGGPKGAGAIVLASEDLAFAPLLTGGGQERRIRAGTEDVAAIAGFGAAAAAATAGPPSTKSLAALRDRLEAVVTATAKKAVFFSSGVPRLANTSCFAVPGVAAETLLIALDLAGVAVSSGSACSSGKVAPSHVLAAMGISPALAKCSLRASLGWESAEKDLDSFVRAWAAVLSRVAPETTVAA